MNDDTSNIAVVVDRDSARHYVWGGVCDGWHLLDNAALSVIEERVPPGAAEMRHCHTRARQFFYVLSGTATLEVENAPHRLNPGQGLHVPPGVAHRLRNDEKTDLRFIVISSPHSHGDRENLSAMEAPA
jgi:mannose-6-phosphate isomerase-like protein (cupin superfamily)